MITTRIVFSDRQRVALSKASSPYARLGSRILGSSFTCRLLYMSPSLCVRVRVRLGFGVTVGFRVRGTQRDRDTQRQGHAETGTRRHTSWEHVE